MLNYVGISENKMKHILGVARKCYNLAKQWELSEDEARQAYMVGYLHDVGYEFASTPAEHPVQTTKLLESLVSNTEFMDALLNHGNPYTPAEKRTTLWYILNLADMTAGPDGTEMTMEERCDDIAQRYGKDSTGYKNATQIYNILTVYLKQRNKQQIYILIAGSRGCENPLLVEDVIKQFTSMISLSDETEVHLVEGEAPSGVDKYSKMYAAEHNWTVHKFTPDFTILGKKAGPLRIKRMHAYISEFENRVCLCIWNGQSKGTLHNLACAEKYHTKTYCYNYKLNRWLSDDEIKAAALQSGI